MKDLNEIELIKNKMRYRVADSTLIATVEDSYGKKYLYRTRHERYFFVDFPYAKYGEEEKWRLVPCSLDEAVDAYESYGAKHELPYEKAFPQVSVEDA